MTGYPMRFAAASASSTVRTMAFWKVSSGMVPSSVSSAVRPSPVLVVSVYLKGGE